MADRRYLLKRRMGWYVRVVVPPSLRPKLNGKREIVRSLKTRNLEEARARRWEAIAQIKRHLNRLRGDISDNLTQDALNWLQNRQETIEANAAYEVEIEGDDGETYVIGPEELADDFFVEQAQEIEEKRGRAAAEKWASIASGKGLPVSLALDLWQEQSTSTEKTKSEQRKAVEDFMSEVGDRFVSKITRRMAGEYVERLRKVGKGKGGKPIAPATINKKITALSSLWKWLRKRGYVDENPWEEQWVKVPRSEKRPYTWEELNALLSSEKLTQDLQDVITIGLYTGMRLEEIAALRVEDIEARGIHVREGKTPSAIRWIPLAGSAQETVERLSEGRSEGWLLQTLKPGPYGKRSHGLSKRFGRLRDKVLGKGIGEEVDFHSLRRTYATVAENVTDGVMTNRLMGHSGPTLATRIYSGGAWQQRMRDAQEQIAAIITDRLAAARGQPQQTPQSDTEGAA